MSAVVATMRSNDMRSSSEYEEVDRWIRFGLSDSAIVGITTVPRGTVRDWRTKGRPGLKTRPDCPLCSGHGPEASTYAYLLGLYLGDGCISLHRRGVYRLRIVLDQRYPSILAECMDAMRAIRSSSTRVGRVQRVGCVEINAYWKHWPCLFPQHGPGRKHLRPIVLTQWQRNIVRLEPARLLRGLIQSDGCRVLNWVNGSAYPRYLFTNESAEIRGIFCQACSDYGVAWRRMNRKTISVARAEDVAKLDTVVGPKR
jgi:hypothetical protein